MKKKNKIIFYILVGSFLLRFLIFIIVYFKNNDLKPFLSPDSYKYIKLAENLYENHFFGINNIPEIIRTPGYPFIMYLNKVIFHHMLLPTIILQILLSVLSIYIVYKIAIILFNNKNYGIIAAILYGVEPLSIVFSIKILTETLFVFFIILFVYVFLLYLKKEKLSYLIISAIILTITIFLRPIAYFLPIIIGVFIVLQKNNWAERFKRIGIFLTIIIILIGSWQVRNYIKCKDSNFSEISAINLYYYHAAAILAQKKHNSFKVERNLMGYNDKNQYFSQHPKQKNWSNAKIYNYMKKFGIKTILKNPLVFFKIYIKGIVIIILDPGNLYYLKLFNKYHPIQGGFLNSFVSRGFLKTLKYILKNNFLMLFTLTLFTIILAVYWIGFLFYWIKLKPFDLIHIFLLVVILYFLLLAGGPNGTARFRHPIMPFLSIYASYFIIWLKNKIKMK